MTLQVQLLHPDAVAPARTRRGDAGHDLRAVEPAEIAPGERALVPTGIAIALPPGTEAQVRPRSGLAAKHGVTVLNAPGTVDEDYRGEIKVLLVNHGQEPFVVKPGERIAQLLLVPFVAPEIAVVAELAETERGAAGFGSSGVL